MKIIEEKLADEQAKLVNTIQELIDCDKKQNEFGGIIVINRHFLNEVLILINRLKEENKELNNELDTFIHVNNKWVENWNKLLKENKELEAENESLKDDNKYLLEMTNKFREDNTDIRKETAEKVLKLVFNHITTLEVWKVLQENTWLSAGGNFTANKHIWDLLLEPIAKQFGVEIKG